MKLGLSGELSRVKKNALIFPGKLSWLPGCGGGRFDATAPARLRQQVDDDVWKPRQLIVVGQEHVATRFNRGREMERVGEPVSLRLSGRFRRIGEAASNRAGTGVRRGGQGNRCKVWSVEEPKKL